MTFQWDEYANDPSHGVLDPDHHGPCAVYMKKVESAVTDSAAGDGWFKIWDDGYDETQQKWCTNKLIDANGLMTVQLPQGLVGGYYLIRPEILALHQADTGDPQFYMVSNLLLQVQHCLLQETDKMILGMCSSILEVFWFQGTPQYCVYPRLCQSWRAFCQL